MNSKFSTFIMFVILTLIVLILLVLGIAIYEEIGKPNVADKVESFVENYTISSSEKKENIEAKQIIKDEELSNQLENLNVDNSNAEVNKYFYNQLDEKAKIIYNALYNNKEKMKTGTYQINLGTKFSDLLSKSDGREILGKYYQSAIEAYIYDNPDVFYLDQIKLFLNIETTSKGNNTTYNVFINQGKENNYLIKSFSTEADVKFALSEIEKIKDYFIQNKKSNVYDNVKMVHDYLIESIEYNDNLENNIYSIYGALINKKCVCEGYANAFKYLLDAINVENTLVIGKGVNQDGDLENHAWNYVKIDNIWYAVDCTWDDPIIIGGGKLRNSSKYKYFLKGQDEFNTTHIPGGQFTEGGKVFTYPDLNKENYK